MKITKKKLLLPISIVATALVTGGVAYAVTSLNFSNQASLWAKTNCTSSLASSKATSNNEQKSIICYNYNKNNEQDALIGNLGAKFGPVYVDGNNNVLGKAVQTLGGDNTLFLDKSVNRLFTLNTHTGNIYQTPGFFPNGGWQSNGNVIEPIVTTYYQAQDCIGNPFGKLGEVNNSTIYMGSPVSNSGYSQLSYYIVSDNSYVTPVTTNFGISSMHSYMTPATQGTQSSCVNFSDNPTGETLTEYYSLTNITLDFTLPVALPISIK